MARISVTLSVWFPWWCTAYCASVARILWLAEKCGFEVTQRGADAISDHVVSMILRHSKVVCRNA